MISNPSSAARSCKGRSAGLPQEKLINAVVHHHHQDWKEEELQKKLSCSTPVRKQEHLEKFELTTPGLQDQFSKPRTTKAKLYHIKKGGTSCRCHNVI